jgi:hypothetical protein
MSDDERYRWLNDVVCTLPGEVRLRSDGSGSDVEYDVAELVWSRSRSGEENLSPRISWDYLAGIER